MKDYEHVIGWSPLPGGSRRRVDWQRLVAPAVGLFHYGAETASAIPDCTPQRLTALSEKADTALKAAGEVFSSEAQWLRRERLWILGATFIGSLGLVVLALLTGDAGYPVLKSFLAAGTTGGILMTGLKLAFSRADHETKLRLFPELFRAEFALCTTCEAYEEVFKRFVLAAESMRG